MPTVTALCSKQTSRHVNHSPLVTAAALLLALALPASSLLLHQVGGGALAAVHAVKVGGHEGTRAAGGALLAETLDLARVIHLCRKRNGKEDQSYT